MEALAAAQNKEGVGGNREGCQGDGCKSSEWMEFDICTLIS